MGCGASTKVAGPGKYAALSDTTPEAASNEAAPRSQVTTGAATSAPTSSAVGPSAALALPSLPPQAQTIAEPAIPALPELVATQVRVRPSASSVQQRPPATRAELLTGIFKRYEAAAVAADASQPVAPLVSPDRVQLLAHILGADLAREPVLVAAAKLLLSSTLAPAFRENSRVADFNVQQCLDLFSEYRAKHEKSALAHQGQAPLSVGGESCVECSATATSYCADCEDTMCADCFRKLHAKGNRSKHIRLDVSMAGYKMADNSDLEKSPGQVFTRWHPFSDAQGLRFFYNFERQEFVKKIPDEEFVWQPPPPLPVMGVLMDE